MLPDVNYADVYVAPSQTIITDDFMGDNPYRLGRIDALLGYACVPEMYYSKESADCVVHYTLGYVSVLGENDTTRQIMAIYDSPAIHKNIVTL